MARKRKANLTTTKDPSFDKSKPSDENQSIMSPQTKIESHENIAYLPEPLIEQESPLEGENEMFSDLNGT